MPGVAWWLLATRCRGGAGAVRGGAAAVPQRTPRIFTHKMPVSRVWGIRQQPGRVWVRAAGLLLLGAGLALAGPVWGQAQTPGGAAASGEVSGSAEAGAAASGQAAGSTEAGTGEGPFDLRAFYLPAQLPARLVFELDSGNAPQIWVMRMEEGSLVTERFDTRQRLLEYQKERLDEGGAYVELFATYTRDSSGRSTPLFAELGSHDVFFWPWEPGRKAVFSYREPRRMDERMGSIRVERERLLLPGVDSLQFGQRQVAVVHVSDLIRLHFLDRQGGSLGEDLILEFRTYGQGLGLLGFSRQFSDGHTLSARRKE
jgi:hypothetical protein